MSESVNRRDFMKGATGVGAALGVASQAFANQTKTTGARIVGANDRINVGVIGVGRVESPFMGRGTSVSSSFAEIGREDNSCRIVAVCDVYQKRVNQSRAFHKCDGYLDYRELLSRSDVDAVIIATADHWHARIALEAMDKGKDVYLEKPMCHTIRETKQLIDKVRESKRVVQVGSQTTSATQWHKAKKLIADGAIGQMVMSQGSYHRNGVGGSWNWPIDPGAGPEGKGENFIDWKMWLGSAPERPFSADRFFRFRKYWDYSGGIASDLFFHVAAPLNICWLEPEFPRKVMAGGGTYFFKNLPENPSLPDREVPDNFHLIADYAKGHSVVLTSSMTNAQHIPGMIRGQEGTIIMVEHGKFEADTDHITVRPEKNDDAYNAITHSAAYNAKFGESEIRVPVEEQQCWKTHFKNFLQCVRTRQKPTLDVETAARAQVLVSMSVQSYREGQVLYFDEKNWKVSSEPIKP